MGVGELFGKSWETFKTVWLVALVIAFVGIAIQSVVKKIAFMVWGVSFGVSSLATLGIGGGRFFLSNLLFNIAGLIVIWTAFMVINFWMQTAIVYAIRNQEANDVFAAVKKAMQQSWGALGPIAVISLLTSLFTGLGFLFLIIPGVFLLIVWQFATLSYVVDGKKSMGALNHSWNLVLPKFWGVLGRNLLMALVIFLVEIVLNKGMLGLAKSLIITPFWVAFSYSLYLDLKK